MGNKLSSSHHHKDKLALTDALQRGDVDGVEQVVASHPEFFASRLDKTTGNNPLHVAVLNADHNILAHLVSFASRASGNDAAAGCGEYSSS